MIALLAMIVLLGVLITVHEFGHFIVAKLSGVRVEVFSIGFGKALLKIQRGETEYRIAQLPLGGYVRMAGMAGFEDEAADTEGRGYQDKPPWVRMLISSAGPLMNLLLPFVLLVPFFLLSGGVDRVPSNVVGAVDRGLPAWHAGLRDGDVIVGVNGEPVYAFWQVLRATEGYDPAAGPLRMKVRREGRSEPLEIVIEPHAEVQTHPVLGFTQTRWRIGYTPRFVAADVVVRSAGPLAKAGLRSFDRIVAAGDRPIVRYRDWIAALAAARPGDTLRLAVERWEGIGDDVPFLLRKARVEALAVQVPAAHRPGADVESIEALFGFVHAANCVESVDPDGPAAELRRGDCILAVDGVRRTLDDFLMGTLARAPTRPKRITYERDGEVRELTLQLEQVVHTDPLAGELKFWRRGLVLLRRRPEPIGQVDNDRGRLAYAWFSAVSQVERELTVTLNSIAGIFSGAVSPTQLSGPLTIAYLAGEHAKAGLDKFIGLMVVISISLALINLLPVPGLDGGHIVVAGLEIVIRRPLPQGFQRGLNWVGYLCILALIIFALGNDVLRMWRLSLG